MGPEQKQRISEAQRARWARRRAEAAAQPPSALKMCCYCRESLPRSEFGKARNRPDGLYPACLPCSRNERARWRNGHIEEARAYDRARHAANPGQRIASSRRRYNKDPERWKREVNLWRELNPDTARALSLRSRTRRRMRVVDEEITGAQWARLVARDVTCYLCGKRNRPDTNSLDHVTPIAKGGIHAWENWRIVHLRCNASKGARLVLLPFERAGY